MDWTMSLLKQIAVDRYGVISMEELDVAHTYSICIRARIGMLFDRHGDGRSPSGLGCRKGK